jgi:hypothetical protein
LARRMLYWKVQIEIHRLQNLQPQFIRSAGI